MDQAESLLRMMKDHHEEKSPHKTRVIAISSGKGGVGKTNLSVALALSLAAMKRNVVLLDGDLGLANVNILFGMIPKYNILHVLQGEKSLEEVAVETQYGLRIIAGASGMSQLTDLSEAQREIFIKNIASLNTADIVLIDTGAGISNNVLQFVLSSHEVILVTTSEPTSITDAYGIMKTITAKQRETDIKLIVNRVQNQSEGNRIAERIINIANKFLSCHIEYLGAVVEDKMILQSILEQKPFYIMNRSSKASRCIDNISERLDNRDPKPPHRAAGATSFFTRFFQISKHKK